MKTVCPPMWCGRPAGDVFVCGACQSPLSCGEADACARELGAAEERAAAQAREEIVARNRMREVT